MKMESYLYILLLLIILISCNNNKVEESIAIDENITKELIKDSSLLEKIHAFVNFLRFNGINNQFIMTVKFDSTEYKNRNFMEISMFAQTCFSDNTKIGGFILDLDVPIVIIDPEKIGNFYYNSLFLDGKIRQSYYCSESVIASKYDLYPDSLYRDLIYGQSFIVDEKNELRSGKTFLLHNPNNGD